MHLFRSQWQRITHLRILLRHIHWMKWNATCFERLLQQERTLQQIQVIVPETLIFEPHVCANSYVLMIAWIRKEAVWKLWQDPVGKITIWDPGSQEPICHLFREHYMSFEKPQGFWSEIMPTKANNYLKTNQTNEHTNNLWNVVESLVEKKTLSMGIKWPGICNCPFRARSCSHEGLSWGGPSDNSAKGGRGIYQIEREKDHKAQETCINRKSIPQWHSSLLH